MTIRIKYGHGYENPTLPGYTPCTAFAGYEPIANPLGGFSNADRERRVFPSRIGSGVQVTYGSHSVQLGRGAPGAADDGDRGHLAVMMSHGGGRQLTPLRICQEMSKVEAGLLAMDEAALYFLLYAISETADDARRQGAVETETRWKKAAEEGRIRRRRGVMRILEPYEMPKAWRAAHAA